MKFNHLNVPTHWQNYWTRYPEGHTILEALIQWVSQVDSMVDNQNNLNDNVEQFRNEIDVFVEKFGERLQDEVTRTLQDWQKSGFLDVVISEALQWQLDDYIATNEQDKLSINQQLAQIPIYAIDATKPPKQLEPMSVSLNDNADRFDLLVTYCLENRLPLYIPSGNYQFSRGIHLDPTLGNLAIFGTLSNDDLPVTRLTFNHTDGTDCVTITPSQYANKVTLENLFIEGNANAGKGIYNKDGKLALRNIRVRNTGTLGIHILNAYGATLENVRLYKTDGKTLLKLENTNATLLDGVTVYGILESLEPSVLLVNAHSTNASQLIVNGQQGIRLINSSENNLNGYHETGAGAVTENVELPLYSIFIDEKSSNNNFTYQTVVPVIDLGYNNHWKTTVLSNTFTPINPKKVINNILNPTFDADYSLNYSSSGAYAAHKGSPYSASYLEKFVTGNTNLHLRPGNFFHGNQTQLLRKDKEYIIQFSIKANVNIAKLYQNREVNIFFHPYNYSNMYTQVRSLPVYDDWVIYQIRFKYTGEKMYSNLSFTINSSIAFTLSIADIVFAEVNPIKKMPNFLNNLPTTGTWIGPTFIPKSNGYGGYEITKSGTFKTAAQLNGTALEGAIITLSELNVGNINDYQPGEYIRVFSASQDQVRKILDVDYTEGVLYIDRMPQFTGGVQVVHAPPTIKTITTP